MGCRLPIMGAIGALAFATSSALAQPGPLPAADMAKQGMERYNAGDFTNAVMLLERAVELEPNNLDYQLSLAHALRQANQCDRARPLYRSIADADPQRKADAEAGLAQCPEPQITPPDPTPAPPAPAPEPAPIASTTSGSVSRGNMYMLMGGGALIGAGAVLLWAGYTHSGDADAARTVADHDRIAGRATLEYVLGGVGIAAGAALSVWAMKRISSSTEDTSVAFVPRAGGGSFVLERSW